MNDKPSLAQKVELQATLQNLDRALLMLQAGRAQILALLQSDALPPSPQANLHAPATIPLSPAPTQPPAAAPPAAAPPAAAPPAAAPPAAAPSQPPNPAKIKTGGYVHHRTRREMLAEGAALGIPDHVLKHYKLLKDGVKPTTEGYLATEQLFTDVRNAKAAGKDPAPLWATYLPPPAPPV